MPRNHIVHIMVDWDCFDDFGILLPEGLLQEIMIPSASVWVN
jgi:hypothetical protein